MKNSKQAKSAWQPSADSIAADAALRRMKKKVREEAKKTGIPIAYMVGDKVVLGFGDEEGAWPD